MGKFSSSDVIDIDRLQPGRDCAIQRARSDLSKCSEIGQQVPNLRTDRARRVMLFGEQIGRHDDIGVHGPKRHGNCRCDARSLARSASRNGFSSPMTKQGLTSAQNRNSP